MLHKEGHRLVTVVLGYELVVIEHEYYPMGQLGELVYEHGKRALVEPVSLGVHFPNNIGCEVLPWRNLAQSLHNVPPQPDRIVVLLVDGDPGEGQAGLFCSKPLGKERRLSVAGRGAYEGDLAV